MARLSLSQVFEKRRRIKVVTLASILLLLFFGISLMVSNNPKGTKAATSLSGENYIINSNSYCVAVLIDSTFVCRPGGYTTISTTDDVVFDGGGAGNKFQFVTYGSNHFKNLTIQNEAIVTHVKLKDISYLFNDVNGNGSLVDDNNPNIASTKVDLTIDNNLTLTGGGNINVDGAGYPGGQTFVCANDNGELDDFVENVDWTQAYGPGRGAFSWQSGARQPDIYGSGGGYGGAGGAGQGWDGAAYFAVAGGVAYPNPSTAPSNMEFGSGGGAAKFYWSEGGNQVSCHDGGNGGGRVYIKAGGIIINSASSGIYANGTDQTLKFTVNRDGAFGGGGSGGSIWIETKFFSTVANVSGLSSVSSTGGVTGGSLNLVDIDASASNMTVVNVTANGGSGGSAGGGGGGRVRIVRMIDQPVTIKKTLSPLERPLNTSNLTFNPYALQKGDLINVRLEISNLIAGTATITDELLEVKYSSPLVYCKVENIGGLVSPPVMWTTDRNDSARTITYTFDNPAGNTTAEINYWCKAQ